MLAPSVIHSRIQAAIATALPTWYPSVRGASEFERVLDGAERSHLSYSVEIPLTTWSEGRQPLSATEGCHVATSVVVRWLYRLRPEARDADYRLALDAEITLLRAVVGVGGSPELRVQIASDLERVELGSDTGPMLLGRMRYVVYHQIALAA